MEEVVPAWGPSECESWGSDLGIVGSRMAQNVVFFLSESSRAPSCLVHFQQLDAQLGCFRVGPKKNVIYLVTVVSTQPLWAPGHAC